MNWRKPMLESSSLACALMLASGSIVSQAHAAAPGDDPNALLGLSLEQLGDVKVTATSRRASRLTDTPASVFVIQGDELRVLGIRSLPEALRLAPNLQVARINARSYAISARGAKTSLSNKLLVIIDGRPIYTPLFAGVLWDMQDVLIDDIDRIEVVSGPGAAAWGANAVNGVINIVTLPARETSGGFARAWSEQGGHGVSIAQTLPMAHDGALRLYAKRDIVDRSQGAQDQAIPDGWTQEQAGFRSGWSRGSDAFAVQGDVFRARSSPHVLGPIRVSGHNVTGRWDRSITADNQWSLQAYYDVVDRLDPVVIDDRMTTVSAELTNTRLVGTHRVTWGLGYRQARDDSHAGALARLIPGDKTLEWADAFVQDQIPLSERLTADVGVRLDSNSYTGVEVLPTLRFSFRQAGGGLVWGAVSRAVRSPARFDREFYFPASEPYIIRGGPDFESEVSNVVELGYRAQPTDWLSVSVTGFHHWYDELRGGLPAPQGGVFVANTVKGRAYGAEGWATVRMPGRWEVAAGFLELREQFRLKSGDANPAAAADQGNDPQHQWLLRATRRMGSRQQVSAFARYVSALPAPAVPSYVQLDARWSFNPTDAVELGVGVDNLLDKRHSELQPADGLDQSVFGRVAFVDLTVGW
jgi:iron complex outermembrane receptor protein